MSDYNKNRTNRIMKMKDLGLSILKIAEVEDISKQRVSQLIRRYEQEKKTLERLNNKYK